MIRAESKPGTFRNVQALRAIAALLVIGVHLGADSGFEARYLSPTPVLTRYLADAGWYGVDLFFVISGFIMTVTAWKLFGNATNARVFLLRRLARIYPPYWALLVPLLLLYIVRPGLVNAHSTIAPNLAASFLLLPQVGEPLLLVSWTLTFEMAFYLVFTVALFFERRWLWLILSIWVAGIALASAYWTGNRNPYLDFVANPLPVEFMFGIVVGTLVMCGQIKRPAVFVLAGVVTVVTLMTLSTMHNAAVNSNLWVRALAAGPGFAALLYGVVGLEKKRALLFPGWLDHLGDASYAMYLWHVPVLSLLGLLVIHLHARTALSHAVLLALALALIVSVALAVYRFIERPLTRLIQRHLISRSSSAAHSFATQVRSS
jgi:exopolysaccharide production protein ExoZ